MYMYDKGTAREMSMLIDQSTSHFVYGLSKAFHVAARDTSNRNSAVLGCVYGELKLVSSHYQGSSSLLTSLANRFICSGVRPV